VVPSFTDGFNLVGGHGIPVRLAMLRGLQEAIRHARMDGPLAEDYLDLYATWYGLEVFRHVIARKKLRWGDGQGGRPRAGLAPRPELRTRRSSHPGRRQARSVGSEDLLDLVPWEWRQFSTDEVNVPRRLTRLRRKAHEVLFLEGPSIAAMQLHVGILRELHVSYGQTWNDEVEEAATRQVASNQAVKVGERDLRYQPRDLPMLLAYYGLGYLGPYKHKRHYKVRYWDLDVLLRLQATPRLLDLRTIPWMRERYILAGDLPTTPAAPPAPQG
jgi:hypothetical protein